MADTDVLYINDGETLVLVIDSAETPVLIIEEPSDTEILEIVTEGPQGIQGEQGIQGPQGDAAGYNFTQVSENATWTINHNLGYKPVVSLFSVGGVEIEGTVTHLSDNTIQVSFSIATAGFARVV